MFIQIKNADIGYKNSLIKNINVELNLGEICLLIGNNGVGKTTLIKSILKQIPLLKGKIMIDNKDISKLSSKQIAKYIAVVLSKNIAKTDYHIEDLIALGKYIHYPYYFELSAKDKEDVKNIVNELNLNIYKDLSLSQLSDGNLQKTYIGRALAQQSPIIILDEPTTHLDEENKIIILKILRKLAKEQQKLILFSSHDWRLAKNFADKIWYIKNQNLQTGIAEDIINKNAELLNPQFYSSSGNFKSPKIKASETQKELLMACLQKNFNENLSDISISYQNTHWDISFNNSDFKAKSFEEIIKIIQNFIKS